MFFATDIANFLACQHIATLNRERVEGKISKRVFADPGAVLLRELGLEQEPKYLNDLKARGLKVVEIATDASWSEAAEATREAMVQGADVVYQATFPTRITHGRRWAALRRDGGPRLRRPWATLRRRRTNAREKVGHARATAGETPAIPVSSQCLGWAR